MGAVEMWAWDTDNEKWVKVKTDSLGRIYTVATIDHLNDIGDVNVPTPTDGHYFYWDSAAGEWKSKSVAPDAVAAVEAAGLILAALKKIIFANDGLAQFGVLAESPEVFGGQATWPWALRVQPKAGNVQGEIGILPKGTSTKSVLSLRSAEDRENSGYFSMSVDGLVAALMPGKVGTGTAPTGLGVGFTSYPYVNEDFDLGKITHRWLESWVMHRQLAHPLPTDHTWAGLVARITAGTALTRTQAVFVGDDGKMELADADLATTMPVIALCTPATLAEDAIGQFLLQGFFRDDTWDWTPGGLIYASVTPGGLSQTAPVGSGDQVQVVGIAMSADIIHFNPSYELVEIS